MTSARLSGRTAVVTGGAVGIGQVLAQKLASEGARVAILDISDAEETVDLIVEAGGRASAHRVDLTDPAAVSSVVDAVADSVGSPDILVNNAGIYPPIPWDEITLEVWRQVFAVNVESMLHTMQAFTPAMRERRWGRVINISSSSVGLVIPDLVPYIASKMAVIGLTRGAATELAAEGITVNSIGPSLVKTPTGTSPAHLYDIVPQLQAIKRAEEPEDLAGAVAFLASDDAAFLTAQNLWVDGGLLRS
ncbi:3-oxoacyl-ACP reductase FabG [Microbacterium pseudoresistens]|uniref:3-oxoacyl-[acyl-carrier protein] reductase/(S)-1-phenylethanol dehydrogenase n=1 Tax=Microbacterium pseudoresistens TaxID=640634 RepID=A0A7Y9ETZ8_9MICO|nr:SDR family NAD(P)-dependent oxidoreductase [Microbacterium pseudoresistens]NYD53764.1 3-oxoacyl-[acyl-carrier protein] reductase/(S)-1-phenylethanol dehydrogenase [Microbacterium pseudoresistens]